MEIYLLHGTAFPLSNIRARKVFWEMNNPIILFGIGITSTDNMLAIALVLWISKYTAQYKNYAIEYRQYLTDNREVTVLFQLK